MVVVGFGGGGDVVVVLPFICGDHRFEIMRCSLHMLADRASRVCAFVVAPVRLYIYISFSLHLSILEDI